MFTPEQLRPLLEAISQTEAVIVGGQAINLWSQTYEKDEEPWLSLRPFTSRDLDVLGSAADVLECARLLSAKAEFPHPGQNTVNTGKLTVSLGDVTVEADFLGEIKGLNNQEIRQTAKTLSWSGVDLRVLHPVLCVESKTVNLVRLPQDVEGRQDKKHLLLAIADTREFLAEQTRNATTHGVLVRWAQRLRSLANDQLGLEAARDHGIDYQNAVPKEMWAETPGCLAEFVARELPHWREEVQAKIDEMREIEAWLRQLKNRP
jgi:hypothetical protein